MLQCVNMKWYFYQNHHKIRICKECSLGNLYWSATTKGSEFPENIPFETNIHQSCPFYRFTPPTLPPVALWFIKLLDPLGNVGMATVDVQVRNIQPQQGATRTRPCRDHDEGSDFGASESGYNKGIFFSCKIFGERRIFPFFWHPKGQMQKEGTQQIGDFFICFAFLPFIVSLLKGFWAQNHWPRWVSTEILNAFL